jgi:hypothetical protein
MQQIGASAYILAFFPGFLLLPKPKLWWLGVNAGRPAINGERISVTYRDRNYPLTFANHDSLLKAFLYIVSWVFMVRRY